MAEYDAEDRRIATERTQGVWTTCDDCGDDWWCVVGERDYLDEPVSWICSDGCDDEDDDWQYGGTEWMPAERLTTAEPPLQEPPPAPIPGDTLTADDLAEGEVGA